MKREGEGGERQMNYEQWEQSVPQTLTGDVLWKVQVYRLALYAAAAGWQDVTKLVQDRRTAALSDQLYRSLGSISANIAEGYSRSSSRDRARFYEYALGSARETRDWYYKARHVLGEVATAPRLDLLTQIIRLLLVMVPDQRSLVTKEAAAIYETGEG